jgi:hypothetical protein
MAVGACRFDASVRSSKPSGRVAASAGLTKNSQPSVAIAISDARARRLEVEGARWLRAGGELWVATGIAGAAGRFLDATALLMEAVGAVALGGRVDSRVISADSRQRLRTTTSPPLRVTLLPAGEPSSVV